MVSIKRMYDVVSGFTISCITKYTVDVFNYPHPHSLYNAVVRVLSVLVESRVVLHHLCPSVTPTLTGESLTARDSLTVCEQ